MEPLTTGRAYVNQMGIEAEEGADRIKAAYGSNYEHLVALCARHAIPYAAGLRTKSNSVVSKGLG